MKKIIFICFIGFALNAMASPILSGRLIPAENVAVDTLKKDGIDPVCKMNVKAGTAITAVHDKVVYGFCSESCKKAFQKAPLKYLKKKP